jgi:hypothetical protein
MMRISTSFLLIFLLFWNGSAFTEENQHGRITREVNFREGPNRSARRVGILAPGTDVLVLRRLPVGWYSIIHQGKPGFVHQDSVKLVQAKEFGNSSTKLAGAALAFIGVTLIDLFRSDFAQNSGSSDVVFLGSPPARSRF